MYSPWANACQVIGPSSPTVCRDAVHTAPTSNITARIRKEDVMASYLRWLRPDVVLAVREAADGPPGPLGADKENVNGSTHVTIFSALADVIPGRLAARACRSFSASCAIAVSPSWRCTVARLCHPSGCGWIVTLWSKARLASASWPDRAKTTPNSLAAR